MTDETDQRPDALDPSAPAGGQTIRVSGGTRDAALHDQLFRYAEDLQQMVERHGKLQNHYDVLKESSAQLNESRDVLDELIRSSSDIHIVTDVDGTIHQTNPAVTVVAPETRLAGSNLQEWVLPSHQDNLLALKIYAVNNRSAIDQEWELHLRREDHRAPPVIVSARAMGIRRAGEFRQIHWILRNVTRQRETEFDTQISSMVFNSAGEGVMITDIEGEILAVNPAFTRITGYSAEEAIGNNPRMLSSGLQGSEFYADFWRGLRENGSWQGELYNRKKTGEVYPQWMTVNAARDTDGRILTYISVFSDLSRLLKAEKRLAYLAHHDTLTGLPNRLLFQDRLGQTLTQAKRSGVPFSVIFIDLDRFKIINDTHGHQVGDQVLQQAAKRLDGAVREVDTVARLGGDEFVILTPGLAEPANIDLFCSKLLSALAPAIIVDSLELSIGASLGCASYPNHGDDEVALMKNADIAMYRAKAGGGNQHVIYASDSVDTPGNPS
jgi:diguanylate cyclase (GGDEF)-like protein/PAS domain S-box-containing protein